MKRTVLAWSVHAYTSLGLVLAAGAAVAIVRGGEGDLRLAFLLLWGAVVVDATDGWLARRAEVSRVLPSFDGRRLDDIVDFHTYVSLPLLLLWRAGMPAGFEWFLVAPLLSAGYGFSQSQAKTDDGFFQGFPSVWNVVAFYLFFLDPPVWFSLFILAGFSVLTFVPTPYLYPSQAGPWARTTLLFGGAWAILVLALTLGVMPGEEIWLFVSLSFPIYYLGLSWWLSVRRGRGRSDRRRTGGWHHREGRGF